LNPRMAAFKVCNSAPRPITQQILIAGTEKLSRRCRRFLAESNQSERENRAKMKIYFCFGLVFVLVFVLTGFVPATTGSECIYSTVEKCKATDQVKKLKHFSNMKDKLKKKLKLNQELKHN